MVNNNYPQLPIDSALETFPPEIRMVIDTQVAKVGGLSLIGVMAAEYSKRQGPGTDQDYLESIADKEGIIVPNGDTYDDSLEHFDQLIGKELPSKLRERLNQGDQSLPKGSLLHAMHFDLGILTTIMLTGVIAREFSPDVPGELVDDMRGHAYFFQAPQDTSIAGLTDRLVKLSPMAQKVLPGTKNGADSIVMIFDPGIEDPDYKALVNAQSTDYAAMPKSYSNDAIAIPIGLPAGAIAGFIVGENVAVNKPKLDYVRSLFPMTPFLSPIGTLVS